MTAKHQKLYFQNGSKSYQRKRELFFEGTQRSDGLWKLEKGASKVNHVEENKNFNMNSQLKIFTFGYL